MELTPIDAWTLLLSTVRYSLGRSTYMTSLSWELVLKYSDVLSTTQLQQIANEIREEVDRHDRFGKGIADRETWLIGASKIEAIIGSR